MKHTQKRWILLQQDEKLCEELARQLNLSLITTKIIMNRGIINNLDAQNFIDSGTTMLWHNPLLLPDMEIAVDRIRKAIDNKEKILIYGDSDVDGITGSSIIYYTFRSLGNTPECYVPSGEGYGIYKSIIDRYLKEKIDLIISVDCGINSSEEIKYAKEKGIDFIITDHHEIEKDLPVDAIAIINPKLSYSKYPFREIAGCTVSAKLCQAVMMSYDKIYNRELVAIDIETTGLNPLYDEIVEISAISAKNFIVKDMFQSLIKPVKKIPEAVTRIHGITNKMCENSPDIKNVLLQFLKFTGNSIIISHNAEFDLGFLRHYLKKYNMGEIKNEIIDTLKLSREVFPMRPHNLPSMAKDLRLKHSSPHRATDDAYATLKLYEKMEFQQNSRINFFIKDNLDLICIGTVADMMPLLDENRAIVKEGLKILGKTRKIGLFFLLEHCLKYSNFQQNHKIHFLSYNIIPALNSCGRLKQADIALDLLITDDTRLARNLLSQIIEINKYRQELQETATALFERLLLEQCEVDTDKIIFISANKKDFINIPEIPNGLLGPVCSYFVKKHNRPCILIINNTGTARTIREFDIHNVLVGCKDLLIKFGGHIQAAGFEIELSKIEIMRKRVKEIVQKSLNNNAIHPKITIDSELSISEFDEKFMDEINLLEPFGQGNPEPVFLINKTKVKEYKFYGIANENMNIKLCSDHKCIQATGYGISENLRTLLKVSSEIDWVVKINMKKDMSLTILDAKLQKERGMKND